MGVSENGDTVFWDPYNTDPTKVLLFRVLY